MHGGHTCVAAGGDQTQKGKKCTKWWEKEITDSAGRIGVIFSCCCHIFFRCPRCHFCQFNVSHQRCQKQQTTTRGWKSAQYDLTHSYLDLKKTALYIQTMRGNPTFMLLLLSKYIWWHVNIWIEDPSLQGVNVRVKTLHISIFTSCKTPLWWLCPFLLRKSWLKWKKIRSEEILLISSFLLPVFLGGSKGKKKTNTKITY